MPLNSLGQHHAILTLEKLDARLQSFGHIQVNKNCTAMTHPTDYTILPQQTRRKMNVITIHPTQALGVLGNEVPGFVICAMDDIWVVSCGGNGRHFDFDGFDAVALVCTDEIFRALGGFQGCDGETLFVVCIDDFADLSQRVFTECGVSQLLCQSSPQRGNTNSSNVT